MWSRKPQTAGLRAATRLGSQTRNGEAKLSAQRPAVGPMESTIVRVGVGGRLAARSANHLDAWMRRQRSFRARADGDLTRPAGVCSCYKGESWQHGFSMGHIQNVRPALGPRSMLAIAAAIGESVNGECRLLPEAGYKVSVLVPRTRSRRRNASSPEGLPGRTCVTWCHLPAWPRLHCRKNPARKSAASAPEK